MYLTNHALMEMIMTYKDIPSTSRLFHKTHSFSLPDNALIKAGDVVEDVQTGRRESVQFGSFYDFLQGVKVGQAKEMPTVYDVLRTR